jgi:Tol biopolymer transport system component
VIAAATVITSAACREDTEPFRPTDRPTPSTAAIRMTYSPHNDRSPVWSVSGDSLYYSAEAGANVDSVGAVLLRLPRGGGTAEPILLKVQDPGARDAHWLVSPAPDPAGARLAFIEILELWGPHPCRFAPECTPTRSEEDARLPPLRFIAVKARRSDTTQPLDADPTLQVDVPGVDGFGDVTVRDYPFQQLFADERAFSFRPSWSPDGERLVYSDGLRLLLWTVGEAQAQPIPDSEDAVWPAWSPDGEWIAFSRLERADSSSSYCVYRGDFGVIMCTQARTDYVQGPHVLSLIRPDGSDLLELGEGDEPAWSPDATLLYYRRDDRIWQIRLDGSGAEAIPGTERGREPAVSPDGLVLAFAKASETGDYDIWTLALEP